MRNPIEGRHWLNDYSVGRIVMALFDCAMQYLYIPYLQPRIARLKSASNDRIRIVTGAAGLTLLVLILFSASYNARPIAHTPSAPEPTQPVSVTTPENWLDGSVSLKGGELTRPREARLYAQELGLTFVSNERDKAQLIQSGALVRLEGLYIELVDVSEPYVLPITLRFVTRLSQQYAAQGCGKLVVTSALRLTTRQPTNASRDSVHPTGMAVDFRIPEGPFCRSWLERTLTNIERSQRVDTTRERGPPHFHAAIVTEAYREWLNERAINELHPELEAMARALYYEGAIAESEAGLEAIAAVIKNRVRSSDYPNSILEVTAEGAAGRNNGSCQFSYMCDGQTEDIETLCRLHPVDMPRYWGSNDPSDTRTPCKRRWDYMLVLAERFMVSTIDPTNGAVLYFAGPPPYWARGGETGHGDLVPGSIMTIGNHTFGRSKWVGGDITPTLN